MNTEYTTISLHEITQLTKLKAPQSVWSVYTVLASYDFGMNKGHCWPSIGSIKDKLGGMLSERRIYSALAWLVEHKVIKRGKARIKGKVNTKRFQLVLRKTVKLIKSIMRNPSGDKSSNQNTNGQSECVGYSLPPDRERIRRKKRRNQYIGGRKKPSGAELRRREAQSKMEAPYLFSQWLLGGDPNMQELNIGIKKILETALKEESEWSKWCWETHQRKAAELCDGYVPK